MNLLFVFLSLIVLLNAAPARRVVVTATTNNPYSMQLNDDIIGCVTNATSFASIIINMPSASAASIVFCVNDEGGGATDDNIILNAAGSDLFFPGSFTQYYLAVNWKTSCFYSRNNSEGLQPGWVERRF